MTMPAESPRPFRLYVTHVDFEGPMIKICGQLDQQAPLMLESLFNASRENLESGVGAVSPAAIREGIVCAAKYKDGTYYRAKILNTSNLSSGLVGVHFIDFGNKDIISLSTIRFMDNYDPILLQLRGQATDYYLSRVINPTGRLEEASLLKLQSLLCYAEYTVTVEAQTRTLPIVSIQFKGNDLSTHLVASRFGISVSLAKQEVMVMQMSEGQNPIAWPSSLITETPAFSEHIPFYVNQNFPSNPASAMRMQQNLVPAYNGTIPPPSMISQRLLVNKVSRNPVNLRPLSRQPQQVPQPPAVAPTSPKKSATFKSRLLEINSQHKVIVSFAEEGPELFAIQLMTDAKKFQEMMDDINRKPHKSLAEPPMIGTVCLGRMSGDRIICRAIVMNLSGSQCKLFFVDFGDTEMVSYYDIFDIPEEFVKPNVFAMRFCLSGVKNLEKSPYLTETFKQLVSSNMLTLKVVAPEGPPLIQYGELYLDNQNVLELLQANMRDKQQLQFMKMEMLPLGSQGSVLVSYVDSCIKFFVQLSDNIDELNKVMDAVKAHCESSTSPGGLPMGAACCARFPDDGNWYRAEVKGMKGEKMVVVYVDYGNEQEVVAADLRTITPELINLPAQAMRCALKGFENKQVETKTSNQLEMLALEKTLMANVVGVLSNDTMLVTLVDDTVTPPLDVARKMNQLSQPRSVETKPTTPLRKDAPESFSSPEEDDNRRSFRREKSFKDDRRPPREGNDEFSPRGGSFRNRDNKEFDRSGPGRHSEKFGGRPERGERRGGSKPWENANNVPLPSEDSWDEPSPPAPAQNNYQSRPNRDNRDNFRDRRKPRPEQNEKQAQRPGWKSKDAGLGKRLKQAAEAACADTQTTAKSFSVQDRLKRDNKFNQQDNGEDRNKFNRDRPDRRENDRPDRRDNDRPDWRDNDRPDRRDNRGEKRDWGDKKDSWNQKKDFRGERQDRPPRSNFTPRDRAEKTDRSFDSDGSSAGQAPPYKPRSKFTQVQYKELPNPVPLETAFTEPTVEIGAQHEISVTWIISPESFYTQILSNQPKFLEMMHMIPELYKGVKSYTGPVAMGASVLARYPSDGVLYRATIVGVQPFSKFIVRYIDFGNKQLVDAKDIWQLDEQLMDLPKMAVHCSLLGIAPKDGEWKANPEIDQCFNAPRYQCVFQECVEELYQVSLWNNSVSVADTLIEKELAVASGTQSSVTLKDEAIDLTIIVSQQMLCKVTHVESYEKLFVQLDLDKAALVEEAIANFDASQLTPLSADSLSDGVHCTVKHEGKVFRAILNSVADPANVIAVLPDYGITITTALENLMILPTELSVYYYQSLQCSLNNYTSESTPLLTLDELKERLVGNKFIVYVNDVADIVLLSTFYDIATGKKVAIFEPDEGAYEDVTQLCSRAVFNYNFGMSYISHSESLNEFYLQKASDGDKIAKLLDDLYKFYEEGTPEALEIFEADGLCAAKSSDGNWYRAVIVSVDDDQVKVQFSDYGNSETVTKESLKKLDAQFYEPCALALAASLGLDALQDDALEKLTEWTTEKEVQVTVAFGTDGWLASLHLDGVDLSMKLVNEKLATPHVPTEETKLEAVAEEPISLPSGCTQVYISHIDTPGHFWLQMSDKVDSIEEIQAELQVNAESYPDIENREMGTLCVAKYLADDQWYRAEILDSDSDITTVRFIDYGNTDVLDNLPGLIKVIPDKLKEVERYGIKSSVNAVPTGTGQWSEPASEYFTQLVGDLSTAVDALIVLKDVTTYVDIFVNGQNLTDKLVSEGHATKSEENVCGDLPSCFASHINSPSEFWIQLETATPELQAMEAAMEDAENLPELTDKEEGVICAAKYPEDGAWYRAQVIVNGSEGTEVLFMDYGNASITNELRSLPDELKVKPALSRKCALQKPRDIKSWSRKSEVKFNELAAEGATIFNIQFIASGDISIVDLYLEGKSVTEELVGLCEEQAAVERPTPVGQDLHSSGTICYVNSLDEFYVLLEDKASELEKIAAELVVSAEFEPVTELKVGSLCAAHWDEDEAWYRAKVLEFCDVGCHVLFIDYGNKAKCEEFRQLPVNLAEIEPLAKCCSLAGFENLKTENAKNKLDEIASDVDATFQIEFLDSTKEPALVKILFNGKDISALLAEEISTVSDCETVEIEAVASKEQVDKTHEQPAPEIESIDIELKQAIIETSTVGNEDVAIIETSTVCNEDVATIETSTVGNEDVATIEISTVGNEDLATIETSTVGNEDVATIESSTVGNEDVSTIETSTVGNEDQAIIETSTVGNKDMIDSKDTKSINIEDGVASVDLDKSKDSDDFLDAEGSNELETSQPDLNVSADSNSTVIENTSFEAKVDETPEDGANTPEKNSSSETLNNTSDTIKTPEKDNSQESINTDTGYTSDKSVPETGSPLKSEEIKQKVNEESKLDSPSKDTVNNEVKPAE